VATGSRLPPRSGTTARPAFYLTYRSQGKSRALYALHEHAEQARQAQPGWKGFWEVACALAVENREQRLERIRAQDTAAKRSRALNFARRYP